MSAGMMPTGIVFSTVRVPSPGLSQVTISPDSLTMPTRYPGLAWATSVVGSASPKRNRIRLIALPLLWWRNRRKHSRGNGGEEPRGSKEGTEPCRGRKHHDEVAGRRVLDPFHAEKSGKCRLGRNGDPVGSAVPVEPQFRSGLYSLVFQEEIVVEPVNALGDFLPAPVKRRIEPLSILPGEILLGRPVELFGIGGRGPPFQVMPELVSERLPGLAPPVEISVEFRQRPEGTVVQNDAAQHPTRGVLMIEWQGDALTEGVCIGAGGMR